MTQHLNLKWSVADVDNILWLVRSRRTAEEICKAVGRGLTEADIERFCSESAGRPYLYRRRSTLSQDELENMG